MQDPAAGRADDHVSPGHEQLLQQTEGAGAHVTDQQESQQNGDSPACHRLHLGLAGRAGEQEEPELRSPHSAYNTQRGAGQHLCGERLFRRPDHVPLKQMLPVASRQPIIEASRSRCAEVKKQTNPDGPVSP